MTWVAVLVTCAGCYAIKLTGLLVPVSVLEVPAVKRAIDVLPAALLASLLVTQTVASGQHLAADLRLVGCGVALVLLALRAPLAVVVVVATAVTAILRAVT